MDAQKQADEYAKENAMNKLNPKEKVAKKDDDMIQSKSENMLESQSAEQEKALVNEKKAVKVVKAAEAKGESMGKLAAKKLMKNIKTQSREQSLNQILTLEKKYTSTSQQVEDIIKNFEGVHKEMAEIKQEYIQQIQENSSDKESKEDSHDEAIQISVNSQGLEGIKSMINIKKDQIQHSMIRLEQEKVQLNELYCFLGYAERITALRTSIVVATTVLLHDQFICEAFGLSSLHNSKQRQWLIDNSLCWNTLASGACYPSKKDGTGTIRRMWRDAANCASNLRADGNGPNPYLHRRANFNCRVSYGYHSKPTESFKSGV